MKTLLLSLTDGEIPKMCTDVTLKKRHIRGFKTSRLVKQASRNTFDVQPDHFFKEKDIQLVGGFAYPQ